MGALGKAAGVLSGALLTLLALSGPAASSDFMAETLEDFENSQFVFPRTGSNVPFPPLAYAGASHYSGTEIEASGRGAALEYDLSTVSQAAGIPRLVGERDALVLGEYLSWSEFRVRDDRSRDFSVASIGLPAGWIRQVNRDWQAAAFIMPLAHKASLDDSHWSWQTMGGVFARYVHSDTLWWAFGAYVDIAPGDDFYIPYLGASWEINQHWTLSGIMPWPALLYAPTPDWLFRVGATPSGASWSVTPEDGDEAVALNLDAWDLGASVERRLSGGFSVGLEAGIGGLRGWRLDGSDFEEMDFRASASPYVRLQFRFRPGVHQP